MFPHNYSPCVKEFPFGEIKSKPPNTTLVVVLRIQKCLADGMNKQPPSLAFMDIFDWASKIRGAGGRPRAIWWSHTADFEE